MRFSSFSHRVCVFGFSSLPFCSDYFSLSFSPREKEREWISGFGRERGRVWFFSYDWLSCAHLYHFRRYSFSSGEIYCL